MCPWQWMDGQGPSGQCSPGQEWWIQLHQWIAVINRMAWRWPVTATRQPRGPRCGEQRAGWLWNAGQSGKSEPPSISQYKVHALQSRQSALLSLGAKNLLVLWYRQRLGYRFISTQGCYQAIVLRTSTRRLDKSWLYVVFPGGPKWNVLHPCQLQCIDMESY